MYLPGSGPQQRVHQTAFKLVPNQVPQKGLSNKSKRRVGGCIRHHVVLAHSQLLIMGPVHNQEGSIISRGWGAQCPHPNITDHHGDVRDPAWWSPPPGDHHAGSPPQGWWSPGLGVPTIAEEGMVGTMPTFYTPLLGEHSLPSA